jgi:hypothetical protein
MAAWPGTLPSALVAGWGLRPAAHTVRSEMESGAARVRRVSTSRADTVAAAWIMSRTQFSAFRAWYESAAGGNWGAAWFTVPLQAGQDAGGAPTTTETARFVGQWDAQAIDAFYIRVTAELEVRDA